MAAYGPPNETLSIFNASNYETTLNSNNSSEIDSTVTSFNTSNNSKRNLEIALSFPYSIINPQNSRTVLIAGASVTCLNNQANISSGNASAFGTGALTSLNSYVIERSKNWEVVFDMAISQNANYLTSSLRGGPAFSGLSFAWFGSCFGVDGMSLGLTYGRIIRFRQHDIIYYRDVWNKLYINASIYWINTTANVYCRCYGKCFLSSMADH